MMCNKNGAFRAVLNVNFRMSNLVNPHNVVFWLASRCGLWIVQVGSLSLN